MSHAGQGNNTLLTKRSRELLLNSEIRRAKRQEKQALQDEVREVKRQLAEERKEGRSIRYQARVNGLDPEEIWLAYQKHDKRCDICGRHESEIPETRLYMDHCHATGKFRGWLCNSCNRGIGFLGDTREAIQKALRYLQNDDG